MSAPFSTSHFSLPLRYDPIDLPIEFDRHLFVEDEILIQLGVFPANNIKELVAELFDDSGHALIVND